MELTIEQALQNAIEAHKAGKLQDAEALYRAILQAQPKHPDANHNLGVLAVSLNKAELALPLFKTALEANSKQVQFWISYVDALIKTNQLEIAKSVLEQGKKLGLAGERVDALEAQLTPIAIVEKSESILQKQPSSVTQQHKKVSAKKEKKKNSSSHQTNPNQVRSPSQVEVNGLLEHYQKGRYDLAENLAKKLTQQYPNHQFSWKVLGAVFKQTGRLQESLIANQRAVAISPNDAGVHSNLGLTLQELGRLEDAEASYNKAIAIKPEYAEAHSNLGNTLKELGRLEDAEASYSKAIAIKPEYAEAHSNLGITLQELGRLEDAEVSYNKAIAIKPEYAEAHSNLGNTLKELGRLEDAEASYNKAIAIKPEYAEAHSNLGITLKELGRLEDAEVSYNKAIAIKPEYAEAHSNLGITLKELGRLEDAEASYNKAIAIKPDLAEAHSNLGLTLKELGRLEDAEASYNKAIAIKPEYAEAHSNLGNTLKELGRLEDAEVSYNKAIAIKPEYAKAHSNLGLTLQELGRLEDAEVSYNKAIAIKPDLAEAHSNLGVTLQKLGRLEDAEASYNKAIAIKPEYAEAYSNLGNTLKELGRLEDAEASYSKAIAIKPEYAEAYNNLGNTLKDAGRSSEAEVCYRRALEIKPEYAEAHSNLGNILRDFGRIDEAEANWRRALEIKPEYENSFGCLLFALNYHPDKSGEEIFEVYREYDAKFGLPHQSEWRPHDNSRETSRRLKVGYVSPDFKKHSVLHFLEPLLAQHDKHVVEVYAYAELIREDAMTARYKNYVDHWIPTQGLSDGALAGRIRADGIDILVDLAGHTANNRLSVFARKPAPVSVSWLGYGYTTGLSAIDYYLTDEASVPMGSEGLFSETPWRLATPGFIYRPAEDMGPVSPLPATERGYVTFGTLTRAVRINHRTIRVWSKILKRVEGARLVIDSRNFQCATMQDALAEKFAAHGIGRDRLEIGCHSPPWDVLRGMDIGLDCFPHNSGTTLFETLYMGIPFVTLAGRPSVGRLGSSILEGAGHPEWIARTEDEYVEIAVALAADLPKLVTLRSGLRQEMQASPLMDEAGFARKAEAAYQEMWVRWSERYPRTACVVSQAKGVLVLNEPIRNDETDYPATSAHAEDA